jgi:hypothetical protein
MLSKEWSENFSYQYFQKILKILKDNYIIFLPSETESVLSNITKNTHKNYAFIRHDVDVSLERALIMARIEKKLGVKATYMIMPNSTLYHLENDDSRKILHELSTLDHEIGLHFNLHYAYLKKEPKLNEIESHVEYALEETENVTGFKIKSVSYHRPLNEWMGCAREEGSLKMCGRIDAYSKELMKWYMSDSKGRWKDGEPLPRLKNPEGALLHLLIHPIWWGETHMKAEERLSEFFRTETQGLKPNLVRAFDAALCAVGLDVPYKLRPQ